MVGSDSAVLSDLAELRGRGELNVAVELAALLADDGGAAEGMSFHDGPRACDPSVFRERVAMITGVPWADGKSGGGRASDLLLELGQAIATLLWRHELTELLCGLPCPRAG